MSQPLEPTANHRYAAWIAALGLEMLLVRVQVPRKWHSRMVGRVTLGHGDHAGPDQFSEAFELRKNRPRRNLIFASRRNLDDLTASVAIAGHVEPRLTANAELAVFAVDHLRRPKLPVP